MSKIKFSVFYLIFKIFIFYQNKWMPVLGIVMLKKDTDLPLNSNFILYQDALFIEQLGYRWIPIFQDEDINITYNMMDRINGLFFTGGSDPIFKKFDNK